MNNKKVFDDFEFYKWCKWNNIPIEELRKNKKLNKIEINRYCRQNNRPIYKRYTSNKLKKKSNETKN